MPPLLLHVERGKLRWFAHLDKILLGACCWLGMPNQEETMNSLKGLHIPSGLGTPFHPPARTGKCGWYPGLLPPRHKHREAEERWMDENDCLSFDDELMSD